LANGGTIPWERSYAEYLALFDLAPEDLRRRILGCGDGPAAFNAELTRRGGVIVSVDLLYRFSAEEIRRRIAETSQTVLDQVRRQQGDYVWKSIASVEDLGAVHLLARERFLADFEEGRGGGPLLRRRAAGIALCRPALRPRASVALLVSLQPTALGGVSYRRDRRDAPGRARGAHVPAAHAGWGTVAPCRPWCAITSGAKASGGRSGPSPTNSSAVLIRCW
jgi:hypothetical protein